MSAAQPQQPTPSIANASSPPQAPTPALPTGSGSGGAGGSPQTKRQHHPPHPHSLPPPAPPSSSSRSPSTPPLRQQTSQTTSSNSNNIINNNSNNNNNNNPTTHNSILPPPSQRRTSLPYSLSPHRSVSPYRRESTTDDENNYEEEDGDDSSSALVTPPMSLSPVVHRRGEDRRAGSLGGRVNLKRQTSTYSREVEENNIIINDEGKTYTPPTRPRGRRVIMLDPVATADSVDGQSNINNNNNNNNNNDAILINNQRHHHHHHHHRHHHHPHHQNQYHFHPIQHLQHQTSITSNNNNSPPSYRHHHNNHHHHHNNPVVINSNNTTTTTNNNNNNANANNSSPNFATPCQCPFCSCCACSGGVGSGVPSYHGGCGGGMGLQGDPSHSASSLSPSIFGVGGAEVLDGITTARLASPRLQRSDSVKFCRPHNGIGFGNAHHRRSGGGVGCGGGGGSTSTCMAGGSTQSPGAGGERGGGGGGNNNSSSGNGGINTGTGGTGITTTRPTRRIPSLKLKRLHLYGSKDYNTTKHQQHHYQNPSSSSSNHNNQPSDNNNAGGANNNDDNDGDSSIGGGGGGGGGGSGRLAGGEEGEGGGGGDGDGETTMQQRGRGGRGEGGGGGGEGGEGGEENGGVNSPGSTIAAPNSSSLLSSSAASAIPAATTTTANNSTSPPTTLPGDASHNNVKPSITITLDSDSDSVYSDYLSPDINYKSHNVHFVGDDTSLYGTPREEMPAGVPEPTVLPEMAPKANSTTSYLKDQIMNFFQPSDNKLAMKLFGNKNALYKEKMRHKRDGNWVIHPCSNFRFYWDLFMLVLLIANLIILPVAISFFNDDLSTHWIVFNCISDTVFFLDIVINFRTGIILNDFADDIILDPKLIAKQYMKTWFFLDLLSSVPMDYIFLMWDAEADFNQLFHAGRALRMFRLVKLLSLLRLLRLSRLVRYVQQWEEFIAVAGKFMPLFNLICLMFLLGHWFGCLQFLVPMIQDYPKDCWVQLEELKFLAVAGKFMRIFNLICLVFLIGHWNGCLQFLIPLIQDFPKDCWVSAMGLQKAHWAEQYTWALFKALSHMLCIGYGRFPPQNMSDTWLTIISMLSGATCYALFLAHTTTLIQSFDTSRRLYNEKFKQVEEYMIYRKLPRSLRQRITDYYEHRYQGKMFDEVTILSELNECLKHEVINHNCRSLVASVPFFTNTDPSFVSEVVSKLRFEVYQPGDYIIREGTMGTKMYFIQEGIVDIITSDGEVATSLSDGSYFGEICLLTNARRVASVRAETYASLYSLSKEHFNTVLERYPVMRRTMESVAAERLTKIGKNPSIVSSRADLEEDQKLVNEIVMESTPIPTSASEDEDKDSDESSDGSKHKKRSSFKFDFSHKLHKISEEKKAKAKEHMREKDLLDFGESRHHHGHMWTKLPKVHSGSNLFGLKVPKFPERKRSGSVGDAFGLACTRLTQSLDETDEEHQDDDSKRRCSFIGGKLLKAFEIKDLMTPQEREEHMGSGCASGSEELASLITPCEPKESKDTVSVNIEESIREHDLLAPQAKLASMAPPPPYSPSPKSPLKKTFDGKLFSGVRALKSSLRSSAKSTPASTSAKEPAKITGVECSEVGSSSSSSGNAGQSGTEGTISENATAPKEETKKEEKPVETNFVMQCL